MVDLDQSLSWETSALGTKILVDYLIEKKVKKIIYASSGSVYGIKKEKKVKEHLSLEPISTYNKVKMVTERLLISYKEKINVVIVRPATVCGISKRMRLDVSVNALTFQALKNKTINVFGGSQKRPNIHIDDLVDVYMHFLEQNHPAGVYNAGFENLKIIEIANMIKRKTNASLNVDEKSNDPRSYRLSSDKLLKTGFKPKGNVEMAINELIVLYANNLDAFNDSNLNVTWLKKNQFN